jgi:hypothetical protein
MKAMPSAARRPSLAAGTRTPNVTRQWSTWPGSCADFPPTASSYHRGRGAPEATQGYRAVSDGEVGVGSVARRIAQG